MRSSLVLCTLLPVALVATQSGGSMSPTTGKATNANYQTPEEVFSAFMAAGAREDWKGMCACLTDGTRDKLAAGLVLAGTIADAFAATEEDRAKMKPIADVLAKHGLKPKQQASGTGPETKVELDKAIMKLVASIKDRNAFIADFLVAVKQTSDDPNRNPVAGQFFDFKDVKLEEVKIQGDSATAVVVARREGKEARQPLHFKKVGDGWKIEFPEGGDAVRRTAAASPLRDRRCGMAASAVVIRS